MKQSISLNKVIEEGLEQMAKGAYERVHAKAIELIQRNVDDPVPYFLLGKLSFDHNNFQKALELYKKAVQLAPENVYCLIYYAQLLTHLSHQNEAKKVADQAAGLKPEGAHLADTLGVIYSRCGFHELAIPWFKQAVSLNPKPANHHYNLGASQQFTGDFSAAKIAYQATLKRDQDAYRALSSLVALNKQTAEDNYLDQLKTSFERLQSDADAALHLGHALAKTYEDLGDYPQSLEWLDKAKMRKRCEQNAVAYDAIFKAVKHADEPCASSSAAKRVSSPSGTEDAPIFVFGLPRTGTTLVDRILSSHADVTAAGELNTFAEQIKHATQTPSNLVMDAETFLASHTIDLQAVGQRYLSLTQDLRRGSKRFTDKMPLNFFYAGLIHQALPNARLIALRRSAMDSCLSNYRQLLTVQHNYYNYTYDLKSTAAFYAEFDALMAHWRHTLPSNRFMEIQYEDIVFDQAHQTRRLLEFCDLDWDEACMNFHQNSAPVSTASSVQVRQPLYSGSIGRWKRYEGKLSDLQAALGPLADSA